MASFRKAAGPCFRAKRIVPTMASLHRGAGAAPVLFHQAVLAVRAAAYCAHRHPRENFGSQRSWCSNQPPVSCCPLRLRQLSAVLHGFRPLWSSLTVGDFQLHRRHERLRHPLCRSGPGGLRSNQLWQCWGSSNLRRK